MTEHEKLVKAHIKQIISSINLLKNTRSKNKSRVRTDITYRAT